MNVQFPNMFPVDLKKGPAIKRGVKLFYGDAYANRIGGYLMNGGASIAPGGTCEADAILSNNATVHIEGTVTGNTAFVDLTPDCYSAIGAIEVAVKWKSSEDDTGTTIVKLYGDVSRTVTDSAYDPGTLIPSIGALMEQVADAVQDVSDLVDDAEAAKTAAQEAAATASAAYGTDLLAADYDSEIGATAGSYYIYSGDLYLCTANTTGAWDSTKFKKVNVGGQLGELKSANSTLNYLIQTNGQYSFSLVNNEYIRQSDGSFQPTSGWSRTGFLPCGGIEKIYVKRATTSTYNAWYDRNCVFMSAFQISASSTGKEISVPANAFYFAISESTASMEALEIWTDGLKAINDMEESLGEEIATVDDKASVGFASGIGTFGVLTQEGKYNLGIVKDEYVNKADGAFRPYVGWDRTEKTICKGATHIYVKKSTSSTYNAWYDKNGDFISTFDVAASSTTGFEVEVPSTAWYFVISDSASVIANLEVAIKVSAIEKLKYEIDLIHESVPGVGTQLSYLTDYFPPLIDTVLSHQSGGSVSMVFITDSHHMQLDNQIDAVSSIEYIIERVGINAVIIGGDDVYDSANESVRPTIDQWFMDYMNEAYRLRSVILPIIGNHDDLTWRISNYDGTWINEPWDDLRPWYYTPTQLYRMNSKRSNWAIVRDAENPTGNYYYYDIPHTDIRVLCLNTSDTPTDLTITKTLNNQETIVYKYVGNTQAIGTQQVAFVENMLRDFDGTLMVCSHTNLNDISEHGCPKPINADAITGMLKAWKNGTSFSYTGTNADIPCSVNVSFEETHTLVGCFNGHTHYDTLRTIDGITYVSILNSQCGAYSDSPSRTDGTYTKIAYDVITIVPEESKVYLTRFGAGDSREFTY